MTNGADQTAGGCDVSRLLLHHRDELFGFILVLVRNHDLAEDLFQETGVAILSEAARGVRPADFAKWARTIARHRVADHFRGSAGRQTGINVTELADAVGTAFDENPLSIQLHRERLRILDGCLDGLADRARTIVNLRYRERQSLRQIAADLHWKDTSVKVALAKARRALAECIERKLGGAVADGG